MTHEKPSVTDEGRKIIVWGIKGFGFVHVAYGGFDIARNIDRSVVELAIGAGAIVVANKVNRHLDNRGNL